MTCDEEHSGFVAVVILLTLAVFILVVTVLDFSNDGAYMGQLICDETYGEGQTDFKQVAESFSNDRRRVVCKDIVLRKVRDYDGGKVERIPVGGLR